MDTKIYIHSFIYVYIYKYIMLVLEIFHFDFIKYIDSNTGMNTSMIFWKLTHYGRQPLFSADFAETCMNLKNGKIRIQLFFVFLYCKMKNNEDICERIFLVFFAVFVCVYLPYLEKVQVSNLWTDLKSV
jgi:hypothetical protein